MMLVIVTSRMLCKSVGKCAIIGFCIYHTHMTAPQLFVAIEVVDIRPPEMIRKFLSNNP